MVNTAVTIATDLGERGREAGREGGREREGKEGKEREIKGSRKRWKKRKDGGRKRPNYENMLVICPQQIQWCRKQIVSVKAMSFARRKLSEVSLAAVIFFISTH